MVLEAIGDVELGAYRFAWGFGFFQFLFEFGASSALQRQISDAWTRGDRVAVNRLIACGINFYTAVAILQIAALLGVAYWALPHTAYRGGSYELIVKLLWLQIVTAPCFGYSVVASSVLQAARRYDFVPRFELAITVVRFVVLVAGLKSGFDFFWVVAAQTAVQVGLGLGPALWVMIRELGHRPHFRGAHWADYKALGHFSFYIALIQISVVLADKIDTTVLGFVLADPGPATAVYDVVSKAFLQFRQTGWMLAYLVMPAVASLAAARDERGLDRVKYDGTRLHLGLLLPVGLLAWLYAGPFLSLWIGDRLGYDAARVAPLMQLFLVAATPAGALGPRPDVDRRQQGQGDRPSSPGRVAGQPADQLLPDRAAGCGGRDLGHRADDAVLELAGARRLRLPCAGDRPADIPEAYPGCPAGRRRRPDRVNLGVAIPDAGHVSRNGALVAARLPLIVHLSAGTLAYIGGYLLVPAGRGDLAELAGKLRRR